MEHSTENKSFNVKQLQETLANMKQKLEKQCRERSYFEDRFKKYYQNISDKMAREIADTDERYVQKIAEFKETHKISLEQDKIRIRNKALILYKTGIEKLEKDFKEKLQLITDLTRNKMNILKRKESEIELLEKQFYELEIRVENQKCNEARNEALEEINNLKQHLKLVIEENIVAQDEWSRNAYNINGRKNEILVALKDSYQVYKQDQNLLLQYKIVFQKYKDRLVELTSNVHS